MPIKRSITSDAVTLIKQIEVTFDNYLVTEDLFKKSRILHNLINAVFFIFKQYQLQYLL